MMSTWQKTPLQPVCHPVYGEDYRESCQIVNWKRQLGMTDKEKTRLIEISMTKKV